MVTEPDRVTQTRDKLRQSHPGDSFTQYVIDRVASGKQDLDTATYSLVYYLAPPEAVANRFNGPFVEKLYGSLVSGGVFEGLIPANCDLLAIKAGFIVDEGRWVKEKHDVVSLKRGNKSRASSGLPTFKRANISSTPSLTESTSSRSSWQSDNDEIEISEKVREVKLSFFEDSDSDDDLCDEDQLLEDVELSEPTVGALTTCSRSGKRRRRACKDCTCGLKEEEEREDAKRRGLQNSMLGRMARSANDEAAEIERRIKAKQGKVVKFKPEELAEIDFTVKGKTGGCGSCALGDAFRCDGCPYLGMPAFKPGQAISLDMFGSDL